MYNRAALEIMHNRGLPGPEGGREIATHTGGGGYSLRRLSQRTATATRNGRAQEGQRYSHKGRRGCCCCCSPMALHGGSGFLSRCIQALAAFEHQKTLQSRWAVGRVDCQGGLGCGDWTVKGGWAVGIGQSRGAGLWGVDSQGGLASGRAWEGGQARGLGRGGWVRMDRLGG